MEVKEENEYEENGEEDFDEQLMTKMTKMIPQKVKSRPMRFLYKYSGG